MTFRLVIFDFDGTLADTFPWFASVLNGVAERYRFRQVAADEEEALRGLSARQVIAYLGVARWKLPFIANHMRRLAKRDAAQIALFDGASALLHRLSDAGFVLAIASSNSERNIRHALGPETAALITHFDCGAGAPSPGASPAPMRSGRKTPPSSFAGWTKLPTASSLPGARPRADRCLAADFRRANTLGTGRHR